MREILNRIKFITRAKWSNRIGNFGFKPNTDQIADARATVDALRKTQVISEYAATGLRDAVDQTEVRDPNINVASLTQIGSKRIKDLYDTLTDSPNSSRLSEDDLGALQYASRLAQEAETQIPKRQPETNFSRRGFLITGSLLSGGAVLALLWNQNSAGKSGEPGQRLPEIKQDIRYLTTEPTPKSPTGWSVNLTKSLESFKPGITGSGGTKYNSYYYMPQDQQNLSVPDARYYPAISSSDVKILLHRNSDGTTIPALEIQTLIDYRTITVRWLIRNHNQIITIQNLNDEGGRRIAYFQALVIDSLTPEDKTRLLVDEVKKAKEEGFILDAYLRRKNYTIMQNFYSTN